MLDALRSGKDIWNPSTTPEALAKEMAGMSGGEKEMFRLGAANALRDRVANAGDGINKVRLVFGSPALREKVRLIAPDAKSMGTLKTFLENENSMFATRAKATGGSMTAENLANDSEVAQRIREGLHMAAQLKAGHVVGFAKSVFAQLGKINPEKRGAVMEAARQVVLNPDPGAVRDFMQRVNAAGLTSKARRRFYGTLLGSLPRATVTNATGTPDRPRLPAPVH